MVAIYVRQSIDKKDSISIESQIENCKREIDQEEIFTVYNDKGYSGKNTKRPEFQKMMEHIKNGSITKVVVYKLDRISRNLSDFGQFWTEIEKYNVGFASRSEKFDTTTPIGRAMLNITMIFAQLERETIQERIRDNYYDRGQKGFYLGGPAPFGYTKIQTTLDNKKTYTFEIDREKADIVELLYGKYMSKPDVSIGDLLKYLNNKNILSNRNNKWNGVSVSKLLRNPVYVKADENVYNYLKNKGAIMNNDVCEYKGISGCYVYGERRQVTKSKFTDLSNNYVTLGMYKGIINSSVWLACQHKLDLKAKIKNSGNGKYSWLSGIMKCGYCGLAIICVSNNKGQIYINCGGRKNKFCYERKRVFHIEDIEQKVQEKLFERLQQIQCSMLKNKQHSLSKCELTQKIERLDNEIKNLVDNIAYNSGDTHIREAIKFRSIEKSMLESEILTHKNTQNTDFTVNDLLDMWHTYSVLDKMIIAKIFIEKVVITDDEIKIFFY